MTNYIVILILLFVSLTLKAQTCDECKSLNLSYPYQYCNLAKGKYERDCSKNPIGTGKKPWKLCIPATLMYDPSQLQVGILPWQNSSGGVQIIFDASTVPSIMIDAYTQWTALCSPGGISRDDNCQKCPIKVKWTQELRDLDGDYTVSAATHLVNATNQTGTTCDPNCEKTYIALNNTSDYINKSSTGYPQNFFYTSTTAPVFTGPYARYTYQDLRQIILHEMGHLFGFDHDDIDCSGVAGGVGVMANKIANRQKTLTNYDKCMFKLLYCCDVQANEVEEPPSINSTFNIFPNPISSGVTIALSPSTAQYSKHLRVLDMGGKVVLEQQFQAGSSDCTVSTSGFAAGSYLFIMTFDGINGSFAQKVVVQ
jgi:hypothetical protein